MIRLSRFLTFALICFACSLAFADGGGAAADPYALYYPVIATGLGALGAVVRSKTPSDGFWHTWYGHALLVLIGAIAGSLAPVFESGHVNKLALASALVGGGVAFLSAFKPKGTSSTAAAALLPLLLLPSLLSSGCHGMKAPEYATLATMAGAAGITAEKLPAICEGQENAAVDGAKTKADAVAVAGAIHSRCTMALTSLDGIGKGLKSARDAVHNAPAGADVTSFLPWIKLAAKQYCDLAPLLAEFKVDLPMPPGVC